MEEQRARQQNRGRNNRPREQNENQPSTSQERPLTGANWEPLQRRPTQTEKQPGPNPDPNQKKPLLPAPKDVFAADYSITQPAPSTSTRKQKNKPFSNSTNYNPNRQTSPKTSSKRYSQMLREYICQWLHELKQNRALQGDINFTRNTIHST